MTEGRSRSFIAAFRSILRIFHRSFVFLLIIGSIAFNIAAFTIAPLADAMLDMAQRFALKPAVTATSELAAAREDERLSKARADRLREDLSEERKRRSDFQARANTAEQRINEVSNESESLRDANSKILQEKNKLENQINETQKKLSHASSHIRQAEARLRQSEAQKKELEKIITRLESKVKTSERQVSNFKNRNETLKAERMSLLDELKSARTEFELVEERATRLYATNKQLELKASSLEVEAEAAEKRNLALQRELNTVEMNRSDLASKNQRLLRSSARLEDDLEVAQEALRALPYLSPEQVKKFDYISARTVRRSFNNATRNLASMPLESLPAVGVLTIVSVTALEIADSCQTAKDIEKLRRMAKLQPSEPGLVEKMCDSVPSLSLSREMTLSQCRAHAKEVRADLGIAAATPIEQKCDCLEVPDGCPDEEATVVRVPPPPTK